MKFLVLKLGFEDGGIGCGGCLRWLDRLLWLLLSFFLIFVFPAMKWCSRTFDSGDGGRDDEEDLIWWLVDADAKMRQLPCVSIVGVFSIFLFYFVK